MEMTAILQSLDAIQATLAGQQRDISTLKMTAATGSTPAPPPTKQKTQLNTFAAPFQSQMGPTPTQMGPTPAQMQFPPTQMGSLQIPAVTTSGPLTGQVAQNQFNLDILQVVHDLKQPKESHRDSHISDPWTEIITPYITAEH